MRLRQLLLPLSIIALLSACASNHHRVQPRDYSKFQQSNPHSILVMLPTNSSVDVKAPYAVMAQTTQPLAESGYYVFPVALVHETFKDNGLNDGAEIQAADLKKIRQVYNPDAILYLNVEDYGTKYKVISSVTTVTVNAKLVDAKDGSVIWTGRKNITVDSSNNSNNNGLFSLMVNAVITQISDKVSDRAYKIAGVVDTDLLSAQERDGILYGPYSPKYKKPITIIEPAN
ncbi:GNA1162 family protein [Snodgrassella sp. ESL0253]|uniref:DUF799 domain-containing protein n=1 Tax=Snodgrassella sp. ESL0253 TaxID=2705031 RepID=UPI00158361C5|nr:GNA1162 family protein [Snodgrassella sp. ESL0253]NUE67329.1 DUF799 domain-containing protein [Snodgrassella sp. ESL0253]